MASNDNNPEDRGTEEQPPTSKSLTSETETNILRLQNETLRWQLAQTESSHQMHVSLLSQMMDILKRVQDYMEAQKQKDAAARTLQNNLSRSNMPRSRSVHHMIGSNDYGLSSPVRMNSRQNFRSAGNVNTDSWNNSKLSLVSEINTENMLLEEVSRIMILANTLINTTLPELASGGTNDPEVKEDEGAVGGNNPIPSNVVNDVNEGNEPADNTNFNLVTLNCVVAIEHNRQPFVPSPLLSNFEENNVDNCLFMEQAAALPQEPLDGNNVVEIDNAVPRLEGGISSVFLIQEVGIPIINVIPPSPIKEVENEEQGAAALHNGHAEPEDEEKKKNVIWV